MDLTIEQAATKLGKSVRQLRYMIKEGRLPARKFAGRWVVDSSQLDLSEAQREVLTRRQRQLKAAVEEALEIPATSAARRYSLNDLKAFQIALPAYRSLCASLGTEHPASSAVESALHHLARGCHRFEATEKASAYREARDAVSTAVCTLLVRNESAEDGFVAALEQDLLPLIGGLLKRTERRRLR